MVHLNGPEFVIFLGAGASVDAGLPTAFHLTEKFKEAVIAKEDEALLSALAFVLGGIYMYHGQQGRLPQPSVNVEELATMLDVMRFRHRNQLAPYIGAWNELLHQFDGTQANQRDLLAALSESLQANIKDWLETPAIGKIRYLQFFQDFTNHYGGLDIFTLNYDLCVETALTNCGVSYTCGFTSNGWEADEFRKSVYQVRLYKMHGSLDWYRDDEDQTIYSLQTPPEDRVPANNTPPLFIFGLVNKLQPVDPYLHLSHTFSEKVKKANVIVIIGYGSGDEYINQIIQQGLSRNSRKRLLIVGYNMSDTQKGFKHQFDPQEVLVKAGRVDFLDGGTAQVLNDRTLLKQLAIALKEANDEGPF